MLQVLAVAVDPKVARPLADSPAQLQPMDIRSHRPLYGLFIQCKHLHWAPMQAV